MDEHDPFKIFYYLDKKYVLFSPKFDFSPNFNLRPIPPPSFFHTNPPPPPPSPFFDNRGKPKFDSFPIDMKPLMFLDRSSNEEFRYFWLVVLFCVDTLLIWFYFFLRAKIKPLYTLKNEIIEFSNGNLNINTKVNGKDEIAEVSNEFNNAIIKIRELTESRNLFLRNIMHELKTPITKGKLISDTLVESRRKEILQRSFYRLEYLLEEFSQIEELTSGKTTLNTGEYRGVDLVDQALDLLLLEKRHLTIISRDVSFNVDFKLFTIALKNMIDNALKYNTNGNPEIFIEKNFISVRNKGDKLKKPILEYLKPFNREYESIDKGLGLGLYITNSIIKIHKFKLEYTYDKGYHSFRIII